MISKKIIIATSPAGKSIPDYMHTLAAGLRKAGHAVVLVMDHKYNGEAEKNDIKMLRWPNSKPRKFEDAKFFYRLCKAEKPDVVLGQFTATNIVLMMSKLAGVKNRWSFQHTMLDQLALEIDAKKMARKVRIKKFILNAFATQMLANSKETKRDIVEAFSFPEVKTAVFNYLIPDKNQGGSILSEKERNQEMLFVSRIDRSKGHYHIIPQIPAVVQEYPELKLTCIGKGSEKEKLEQRVRELGLEQTVKFVGFKKLDEVFDAMRKSKVHISASEAEAFGLVNVEALSCGTPVLAPAVGGIKEIVEEGKNGFFYEPKKNGDFLEKLTLILADWESFSKNARSSFEEKFSADNPQTIAEQVRRMEALIQ